MPLFEEIAELDDDKATARMQQMYLEPIKLELVAARIKQMKDAGIITSASVTPARTSWMSKTIIDSGLDILVIQGTVVSAEHVSKTTEPLNLKKFIREFEVPVIVGGCASYQAACTSCAPARLACSSASGRATPARRAGCSASACRRRRPSPTSPARACATSTRRASTCTSSPTAA
jgi:hypothetical protein